MSAARKPGKRHARRARAARRAAERLYAACSEPGSGWGFIIRAVGIVIGWAALIVVTNPNGGGV